ncbi:hypothetical protein BpHYR1_033252 [Brachionus plicatilis]|uniref:Uncharacterized protein n=1 Tax=Brachionus plicatilis TaxID=10195 RepID=A0A3M7PI11_BRAPC|nr:hypothetical protein BpHYR1_033252 [Brachionus plicatilis]
MSLVQKERGKNHIGLKHHEINKIDYTLKLWEAKTKSFFKSNGQSLVLFRLNWPKSESEVDLSAIN